MIINVYILRFNYISMAKVFFCKDIDGVLKADFSRLGKKVAIKVHFGERGCTTFLNPVIVRKVFDKIKSLGKDATLVECNVLYKGSRTNATDHIKTAREHGFDMPIDILDGECGDEFVDVKGCKIGKGISKYDSLVVVSHFKGHMMAGFGGAIKNVGMGLGSRAGKLFMHSTLKPFISEKCTGCGTCVRNCNANAIEIINGKARIDSVKCEGCAMCIAVCEYGAASVPWQGGTSERLQKNIADYTSAVLSLFPGKVFFVNVLEKITEECDCMGTAQTPVMDDVGIVFSDDIVAVDKASLDLANKYSGGQFNKINAIDKDKQIEFAEGLGLGSSKYELVE